MYKTVPAPLFRIIVAAGGQQPANHPSALPGAETIVLLTYFIEGKIVLDLPLTLLKANYYARYFGIMPYEPVALHSSDAPCACA
jgi:hypothetical protein